MDKGTLRRLAKAAKQLQVDLATKFKQFPDTEDYFNTFVDVMNPKTCRHCARQWPNSAKFCAFCGWQLRNKKNATQGGISV